MKPLSPRALVATAAAFAGLREGGTEVLPCSFVDVIRRQIGKRGAGEWDAALVYHWGFWSQFDFRTNASAWPLPPAETAEALGSFAQSRGILLEAPAVGDVFLQYSPRRAAFVRSGVVTCVFYDRVPGAAYWDVVAVEGNSGEHGELGGTGVTRLVRRLSPQQGDRFMRWPALARTRPKNRPVVGYARDQRREVTT